MARQNLLGVGGSEVREEGKGNLRMQWESGENHARQKKILSN